MTKDKNTKSKGEYTFMRQIIKKPPRKTGRILKKIVAILLSGIAIGIIAAITFVHVLPYFQPEDPNWKVEFPDDSMGDQQGNEGENSGAQNDGSNDVSQDAQGGNNADSQNGSSEVVPTDCPDKMTLEGFRQIYEEIVDVAEQSEKALVVVQGIKSEVDWMNNSYENKTQVSGILVAENTINYYK